MFRAILEIEQNHTTRFTDFTETLASTFSAISAAEWCPAALVHRVKILITFLKWLSVERKKQIPRFWVNIARLF
jgi:hypothetical protein